MSSGDLRIPGPGTRETESVSALSRSAVVEAYARWGSLTDVETICVDRFLDSGNRILDLGCGAGRFLAGAGTQWKEYLGVDCSIEMIGAARSRFPSENFVVGDVVDVRLDSKKFDAVLMLRNVIDMLHPVERRAAALSLVTRVLHPGGVLIASSHRASPGRPREYTLEDYHGSRIWTYRSQISDWCRELEEASLEPLVVMADGPSAENLDWAYIVARLGD